MPRLHADELPISKDLVRALVDVASREYAELPLIECRASGSSNRLFRLGDDLLVRLPRQPGGGATIDTEARWIREIAALLPVATPEIVTIGEPGYGYPEKWSIVRWIAGEPATAYTLVEQPTIDRARLAVDVADVIRALRTIDRSDAAANDSTLRTYRGCALAEFDAQTRINVERCRSLVGLDLDLDAALAVWSNALKLPGASDRQSDRWYHGDLVAENLLLADGMLCAVLDFGSIGVGDPTVDLHGAWELFDPPARAHFRDRLDIDDDAWLRGRAWALAIALSAISYYWQTMPRRCEQRLSMARSVLDDARGHS
jgi:aminoglycoside phosphotransferase (APT) family kinase protein